LGGVEASRILSIERKEIMQQLTENGLIEYH